MVVNLNGVRMPIARLRLIAAALAAALLFGFYVYGPPITPAMQTAAAETCNEHAEGNFRSYRLEWEISVVPHWRCSDVSKPGEEPVNLGWWAGSSPGLE